MQVNLGIWKGEVYIDDESVLRLVHQGNIQSYNGTFQASAIKSAIGFNTLERTYIAAGNFELKSSLCRSPYVAIAREIGTHCN